jgi:hypothetical protein
MFEIVLKQDYEDIFFFRDFEVNGITNNSQGNSPIRIVSASPGRRRDGSNGGSPDRTPGKYSFHNTSNNQFVITNQ